MTRILSKWLPTASDMALLQLGKVAFNMTSKLAHTAAGILGLILTNHIREPRCRDHVQEPLEAISSHVE